MKKNIKIYINILKLLAIVFCIYTLTYSWFTKNEELSTELLDIKTVSSNEIEISLDNGETWSNELNYDISNGFNFTTEVTSNGIQFLKADKKLETGEPISLIEAAKNKDYLEFEILFKSKYATTLFLEKKSSVTPSVGTNYSDLIGENVIRKSQRGNFSKDLIASSVRIAFIEKEADELKFIWAPNKFYELVENNDYYTFEINSNNIQKYEYLTINNNTIIPLKLNKIKDEINANYDSLNSNGDYSLGKLEGEEKPYALIVRIWIEGQDRDALEPLKSGKFKTNFFFAGITKEDNPNIPDVYLEENIVTGITKKMEYSLDNGMNWIDYDNQVVKKPILVRYKETAYTFASEYIEIN